MNREKLKSLQRYQDKVRNLISSGVPDKHKNHVDNYKRYLQNELKMVTDKIEAMKLEVGK